MTYLRWPWKFFSVQLSIANASSSGSASRWDQISGVDSGGVPPVPIPNTAVKPASADGSRTAGSLESRSAPDYTNKTPLSNERGFFVCSRKLFEGCLRDR